MLLPLESCLCASRLASPGCIWPFLCWAAVPAARAMCEQHPEVDSPLCSSQENPYGEGPCLGNVLPPRNAFFAHQHWKSPFSLKEAMSACVSCDLCEVQCGLLAKLTCFQGALTYVSLLFAAET